MHACFPPVRSFQGKASLNEHGGEMSSSYMTSILKGKSLKKKIKKKKKVFLISCTSLLKLEDASLV